MRARSEEGRLRAVGFGAILHAHDLALEELRRRDLHLEGALLANFFIGRGLSLHSGRLDDDGFAHRQVREEFGGQRALRRGRGGALVGDRLPRRFRLGRQRFQFAQLEEQLLAVEQLFGLGAAEDLPAQPRELALQVQQFALRGARRARGVTAR